MRVGDYFDALYCINLARRPDRWTKITDAFQRACPGTTLTRIDAIDGKGLGRGSLESSGAMGCVLSHARAHETILRDKPARALVLEDDVLVPDDLSLRIGRLVLAPDWDAIILGRSRGWGAFAYGVTPRASAIMLPRLQSARTPADQVLLHELPRLARVVEHHVFLHDYAMGSDIASRGRR